MEEKLTKILGDVNGWLKFLEAKNGILIAFIGASIWASLNYIIDNGNPFFHYYLINYVIFSWIGLLVSLFSILPQIKVKWLWPPSKPKSDDNLAFFGHLEKYDKEGLIEAIEKKYDIISSNKLLEYDLADQIIQNSIITMRKYRFFSVAFWCVIAGIFTFPVGVLLYFFLYTNE